MEKREKGKYQVEFTPTSRIHFYEVLDYLYENYQIDKAEQLADKLEGMAQSLERQPQRGVREQWLLDRHYEYRFILFRRTIRASIKIIYYIDEQIGKVYVTDFFPTEKDDSQITQRNN